MSDESRIKRNDKVAGLKRRDVLKAGLTLAVSSQLMDLARAEDRAFAPHSSDQGPYATKAFGATESSGRIRPVSITRRALGSKDVLLDILYAGICHSDIHTVRGDWGTPNFPVVPGHEIIGRVVAVGSAVTKFRVGDIGGVGCMVDSCGNCDNCLADREQVCRNGTTFTYDAPDKVSGGFTYGGYADKVVVTEKFVIRIPPGMDLASTAPILCAGITTFSPMQHWNMKPGMRVGVVGIGGLGHMAVKIGAARRAEMVALTTTPSKVEGAKRLGAKDAALSSDPEAMKRLANSLDLIISTVPVSYKMQPFLDLLKLDGTFINVGALGELEGGVSGMSLAFGRKSIAGSMIGGLAETQEVIDFCYARGIKPDVELIAPDDINRAIERVVGKDVRYRFVIDMASLKA